MPRKTKESDDKKESLASRLFNRKTNKKEDIKKEETKKTKTSTKKTTKSVDEKKTNSKTSTKKSTSSKKDTITQVEKSVKSKTTKKEKIDSSKEEKKEKKSPSSTTIKKETSKSDKTSSSTIKEKKASTTKKSKTNNLEKENRQILSYSPEYYDLPYSYNQTTVKILAQTPNNLFVYWEISDKDREDLKQQYGQYFFEITKPVLIVYNETMNYSFELDINDFANSWYLHINDSNCKYRVELGRRPIPINYTYISKYDIEKEGSIKPVENSYIYISTSNPLESPNDHILFNKQNKIYFRNIKTNEVIEKDVNDFPFVNNNNNFVDIYTFYEKLYKDEISNHSNLINNNPSSGNPSSGSFSSKFQ